MVYNSGFRGTAGGQRLRPRDRWNRVATVAGPVLPGTPGGPHLPPSPLPLPRCGRGRGSMNRCCLRRCCQSLRSVGYDVRVFCSFIPSRIHQNPRPDKISDTLLEFSAAGYILRAYPNNCLTVQRMKPDRCTGTALLHPNRSSSATEYSG